MTTFIGIVLGVVVTLALLPVVAAVLYRLVIIRRNSTSALARRTGDRYWCHGAVRYSDTDLAFYRLASLRFGADTHVDRRTLVLGAKRQPAGPELEVAEEGEMIVDLAGRDRRGRAVEGELCLGPAELTALSAWVEACSTDQIRRPGRR